MTAPETPAEQGLKAGMDEFVAGYMDGYDLSAPEPSENRSHAYRHSFAIGRAEKQGLPIAGTADHLRAAAERALEKDLAQ